MRHLAHVLDQNLRWMQPRGSEQRWELLADSEVAATLSFRSRFGSFATACSADGAWTFKRVGFWQTKATVRAEGSADDLAFFEHNTWNGGGTLHLAAGRSLLVTTNFWQTRLEFRFPEDQALFRYRTEGFLRLGAEVENLPGLERLPEMPWLLLFGWYLVVMMYQDAANTVVIIG